MKRVVLFSTLTESNSKTILDQIFPSDIQDKVFSYIPSSGIEGSEQYIEQWKEIANKHKAQFNVIDNTVNDSRQKVLLLSSNIVVISGGNTFNLLHNLRKSGLDRSLRDFAEKQDFILAGFSAGALVLTPTIEVCNLPDFDENLVGIDDFSGLNIVNFEIFPHYERISQETTLNNYRKTTNNKLREITNEDFISINL